MTKNHSVILLFFDMILLFIVFIKLKMIDL